MTRKIYLESKSKARCFCLRGNHIGDIICNEHCDFGHGFHVNNVSIEDVLSQHEQTVHFQNALFATEFYHIELDLLQLFNLSLIHFISPTRIKHHIVFLQS